MNAKRKWVENKTKGRIYRNPEWASRRAPAKFTIHDMTPYRPPTT